MIKPLALYIGLRYTRAKRRNHFISFISLASMLGIALGVTVLITVLSVMNGFDYQISTRFFAIAPQVTVMTPTQMGARWKPLAKKIDHLPGVVASAPFVSGKGMVVKDGQLHGLEVVGILPSQEHKISALSQKMVLGTLGSLKAGRYRVVIGQSLADRLRLSVGDKVNLLTPQTTVTLAGVFPRYKTFTVSGIFHASGGFGFENAIAYTNFTDAAKLYPSGHGTQGLHIKLKNLYQAQHITNMIRTLLPYRFVVSNWTQQYGAFFEALAMEKTMLFIILLLIVAVAAFNLVSTLVMVVNDKRADIAILRTLGASPLTIMGTFVVQGAVVGLVGVLLGLIGGVVLSLNVTALTNFIQNTFHVQFISSSVYFIDYLPSRIQVSDIVQVSAMAFGLSLLATLYPAFIAFRTQPAEALRYE